MSEFISSTKLRNNQLELITNNPSIDHLISPIAYRLNRQFLKRYLVAEFKDVLGNLVQLYGKYQDAKFIFKTNELSPNKLWTLNKFLVKEKELLKPNQEPKVLFEQLDIRLAKPVHIIKQENL